VLTYLKNWDKLFESPFKSDVYFFSTRLQLDCKWGTPNPITIRDKDFGMVRMRAFGIYSYKLADARKFHSEISGTREQYTVADLDGQLRNLVISSMTDLFGESGVPFIDMAANQDELSRTLKGKLEAVFDRYGLALDSFVVQNVTLPEELQKILDTRIGMNMIGDLGATRSTRWPTAFRWRRRTKAALPARCRPRRRAGHRPDDVDGDGTGPAGRRQPAGATASALPPDSAGSADEVVATLEKLHTLVTKGILSQAEFDAKKAELAGQAGCSKPRAHQSSTALSRTGEESELPVLRGAGRLPLGDLAVRRLRFLPQHAVAQWRGFAEPRTHGRAARRQLTDPDR
jgi:hypothetical protein